MQALGQSCAVIHVLTLTLYKLFVCLLKFLLRLIFSLLSSFVMLSFLLIYILNCLLPGVSLYSFQNRPVLFPGWRS